MLLLKKLHMLTMRKGKSPYSPYPAQPQDRQAALYGPYTPVQVRRARKDANIRTGGMDSSATVKSPIAKGSGDHHERIFSSSPPLLFAACCCSKTNKEKSSNSLLPLRTLVVCSINKSLHSTSSKDVCYLQPFLPTIPPLLLFLRFRTKNKTHFSPFTKRLSTFFYSQVLTKYTVFQMVLGLKNVFREEAISQLTLKIFRTIYGVGYYELSHRFEFYKYLVNKSNQFRIKIMLLVNLKNKQSKIFEQV